MKEETKQFWREWSRNLWAKRYDYLRQLVIGVAMVGGLKSLRRDGPALYSRVVHLIGPHLTQLIIGIMVLCVGFAAHRFKRKSQKWYGTVEVIFGVVSGFSIAFNLEPDKPWLPQGATLVGCAYVIARGMNNFHEAKPKESTESPQSS